MDAENLAEVVGIDELDLVADVLRRGGVVAIPTDTVYGLAALGTSFEAQDKIYDIKGRPADLALPMLCGSLAQVEAIAGPFKGLARRLAVGFWPGALTVVVETPRGGKTLGLRVPDHDFVCRLALAVGPLAVTSANLHGHSPAVAVDQARLPGVSLAVDGGPCDGVASTVVRVVGDELTILRQGALDLSAMTQK